MSESARTPDAASDHGPVHRICGKPVQWLYMRWWCPACQRTVMPGSLKEAERA